MQLLLKLLAFITPYGTQSYFMMFGILLACGFGLPMPEDIVLITGGILSARGITDYWMVNVVCMAGVLVGDGIIFGIGRHFGPGIKKKGIFKRIFTEARDKKVQGIFHKYGDKVIFMGRFMPGLRTPIFLTSGIYQVRAWKFFLLDGSAALISVPLWIWIGHKFGENLEELEVKMRQFQYGIYVSLAVLVVAFFVFAYVKKRYMSKIEAP